MIVSGPHTRFGLMFRQPADPGLKTGRNMSAFSIQIPLPSTTTPALSANPHGIAEMPSFSSALPILNSCAELCDFFEVSEFSLKRFCFRAEEYYHKFQRKKKSGNGTRKICAPSPELKVLQRKIKTEILDRVDLHDACTGYRRGMSIVSNASIHVEQRCILNIDIKDFFQSIGTARVAGYFAALGYPDEVAVLLSKLCCFQNALPQGAPSSPALANLICHKLDRRLAGLAGVNKMKYSRYCDDITFSTQGRINTGMVELLTSILQEEGFTINSEKTRILSRKSCQIVTGLTVNSKVNIPRRKRRRIRAIFHQSGNSRFRNQRQHDYLNGLASFLKMVNKNSAVLLS